MAASSITMPDRHTHAPRAIHVTLLACGVAAIAWGALAFGAVYPWAYATLATICAAVGVAALAVRRHGRPAFRDLAIGLVAIGIAIGLQLVALPLPVLTRVSPGTDAFLAQYDFSYQLAQSGNGSTAHAVSIAPDRTAVGAALFAAFALF